tara:strand:+ start:73 stop:2979 length:2907 start_codon:yes stop_codon:yes gene_type:complete
MKLKPRPSRKSLLTEQQVSGGNGTLGNVWQICGITPGSSNGQGFPSFVSTQAYGDIFDMQYSVNGSYLGVPNYPVPEKCNGIECGSLDEGEEFVVTYLPNSPMAAQFHLKLVSVGTSTPTVTNVCLYGAPGANAVYNCPHYFTDFQTGSCLPDPGYGCTDSTALNFNPLAIVDDGSCLFPVYGCTQQFANNYNPAATIDDGSCAYTDVCHVETVWEICDDGGTGNYPAGTTITLGGITNGMYSCHQCNGAMCTTNDIDEPFLLDGLNGSPQLGLIGLLKGWATPLFSPFLENAVTDVCPVILIPGCMNQSATNYDPNATIDDGSCIIYGCMDISANNYNATATIDYVPTSCLYDVLGCTDATASNYDSTATVDDGTCYYLGCIDVNAENYLEDCFGNSVPNADTDEGCCDYLGCTNPAATNYDINATIDDGSCVFPTVGCTDSSATNYNPLAVNDDGSCFWEGCTDSVALNYLYNCLGNSIPNADTDDGCCIYPIIGCDDPQATNYDPTANVDCLGVVGGTDTSCCIYPVVGCVTPIIVGPIVNTSSQFCVNGCYVYDSTATGCPDVNGYAVANDTSCCCTVGCTDPTATNYNSLACIDNGSCIVPQPLYCSCCQNTGPGTLSSPVAMTPIPWNTLGACLSWNSQPNLSNCDTPSSFNQSNCDPDCTTFDYTNASSNSNSLGSDYSLIMDAYNLGITNGQTYGILDGNSIFCVDYCGINNSPHFSCDCCGDIHDCDNPSLSPKPFGCWNCKLPITPTSTPYCGQPSISFMNSNPSLNYYNNQNDCLSNAPTNCPPSTQGSCATNSDYCQTNPQLTPQGSCWFCHHGVTCLPIYDYLEYGSGPPGSTGTYAFMMSWLYQTTNGAGVTIYQAGTNSTLSGPGDLYCNAQDCVANSICTEWDTYAMVGDGDCKEPPTGCPKGEVWLPAPDCKCKPIKKKKDIDVEDEEEEGDKKRISEEIKRMNSMWNYKL